MQLLAPSLPRRRLLHQGLMQMIDCRIFIREAPERNYHPPLLVGRLGDGQRFRRDELIWALASDGRSWHRRQDHDAWLTGKAGVELLRPAPDDLLRMWPVSKRVNKTGVGDDDPSLIEPFEASAKG
jgi:hypothetical protein